MRTGMKKRKNKTGKLGTIVERSCAREVWKLVSLLEYKYQVYLYDAVVDYVKTGRREVFGSKVMQEIFNRITGIIDAAKGRDYATAD